MKSKNSVISLEQTHVYGFESFRMAYWRPSVEIFQEFPQITLRKTKQSNWMLPDDTWIAWPIQWSVWVVDGFGHFKTKINSSPDHPVTFATELNILCMLAMD